MPFHRILTVPAEQIKTGDVIVVYRNIDRNWRSFSSGSDCYDPAREKVLEATRDPADGTIYVNTAIHSEYLSASSHLSLDCLETFGRNGGG